MPQTNTTLNDEKQIILPKNDSEAISPTERLVREEIKKMHKNAREIRRIKKEIEKVEKDNKSKEIVEEQIENSDNK